MGKGREITIVFQLKGRKASGTWQPAPDGERRDIAISGMTQGIPWEEGIWEKLFSIIQLNQAADRCRILVISDRLLSEQALPELRSSWEWTLEELSQVLSSDIKQTTHDWVLNGESLSGRFRSLFPQIGGNKQRATTYLCTAPPLSLPETDTRGAPLGKVYHETLISQPKKSTKSRKEVSKHS